MATFRRLWPVALPVVAIVAFAVGIGAVLLSAGDTLGYDYRAYLGAATRLLDGRPLFDTAVDVAGPFAIYLYPPPFAVAFVPFAWLATMPGIWLWTGLSVAMVAGAIAILPVRPDVRWTILLLAGLDWPVAYAIKLGQVGPLLLLLFAIGWRSLERPAVVGTVAAIGTLVKLQPALLFGWAFVARRTRAVAIGLAVLAGVVLVTLPLVGIGAYTDYVEVLRRVASPVTTPNNVTPGAILYRAGLGVGAATVVQLAVMVGVFVAWVVASRWRAPVVGFVVTVVASQLLSPLLWDHYAMLLLLPTALLLEWGRRWAVLIPLATCLLVVWVAPAPLYQASLIAAFAVALVAPLLLGPAATPMASARRT